MKNKLLILAVALLTACESGEVISPEELPDIKLSLTTLLKSGTSTEELTKSGSYNRDGMPDNIAGIKITNTNYTYPEFSQEATFMFADNGGADVEMPLKPGDNMFEVETIAANSVSYDVEDYFAGSTISFLPSERAQLYASTLGDVYAHYEGYDFLKIDPDQTTADLTVDLEPLNGAVEIFFESSKTNKYNLTATLYDADGKPIDVTSSDGNSLNMTHSNTEKVSAFIFNGEEMTNGTYIEVELTKTPKVESGINDFTPEYVTTTTINTVVGSTVMYIIYFDGSETVNSSFDFTFTDEKYDYGGVTF